MQGQEVRTRRLAGWRLATGSPSPLIFTRPFQCRRGVDGTGRGPAQEGSSPFTSAIFSCVRGVPQESLGRNSYVGGAPPSGFDAQRQQGWREVVGGLRFRWLGSRGRQTPSDGLAEAILCRQCRAGWRPPPSSSRFCLRWVFDSPGPRYTGALRCRDRTGLRTDALRTPPLRTAQSDGDA